MEYSEFKEKYHIQLNEQQEAAVKTTEGSFLVLAVPGSGKTTMLISRLGYMIFCCGIAPEQILTMTYTIAATADMSARFAAFFGPELAARMEFRTINGVCARIIRRYELTRDTTAFALVSDEKQTGELLAGIYRKISGEYSTESDIKNLRTCITYAKNMQLSTDEELEKIKEAPENFAAMVHEYRKAMREHAWMDYDDQMQYALSILKKCPDILNDFQKKYRYLCVDEAQDTSKIQHRIISLLAGENGNLFMVGDEDQSIYGFRAAWPEALERFEEEHSGAKTLLMENNYRSTPEITEAAGRFIRLNHHRHEKNMKANRDHGPEVHAIPVKSRSDQYNRLEKIAKDCTMETAVLYRDNDCALPLIDVLNRENIPYRCRQVDSSFFTNRVVMDLSDIILYANDPTDRNRFLKIYYKFGAGIKKTAAEQAVQCCPQGGSVIDWLILHGDLTEKSRARLLGIRAQMERIQKKDGGEAIRCITDDMGYGDYLKNRKMDTGKAEIMKTIGAREPNALGLLRRLDELKVIINEGSADPESKLILSTVHSSKGLEYDRVFMMDVFDGLLPGDPTDTDGSLEEERRIFYVGMTRAKNELCIFTFPGYTLKSSFADAVFKKEKNNPPKRHLFGALSFDKTRETETNRAKENEADFFSGATVRHKSLGVGEIVEKEDGMITVEFEDGKVRRILLEVALKSGQLQAVRQTERQ